MTTREKELSFSLMSEIHKNYNTICSTLHELKLKPTKEKDELKNFIYDLENLKTALESSSVFVNNINLNKEINSNYMAEFTYKGEYTRKLYESPESLIKDLKCLKWLNCSKCLKCTADALKIRVGFDIPNTLYALHRDDIAKIFKKINYETEFTNEYKHDFIWISAQKTSQLEMTPVPFFITIKDETVAKKGEE